MCCVLSMLRPEEALKLGLSLSKPGSLHLEANGGGDPLPPKTLKQAQTGVRVADRGVKRSGRGGLVEDALQVLR